MVKNFLIAEAGINHGGNIKTALKLVGAAKKAGADSIKFQTYKTEKRINKKHIKIFEILKKCELNYSDFKIIKDYCDHKKITFFSTPFDLEAVDFLAEINVKLFKVASFDISNNELINKVLSKNVKTIVSTGMASVKEIDNLNIKFQKKKVPLILMHCVSSYPNKSENSYLSNIEFLKKRYKCEIGLSDHTNDIKIPIYSGFLGVKYIEKHFKINKYHKCVDEKVSITTKQFIDLKKGLDKVNKIMGKTTFGIKPEEKSSIVFKRKKIY